jgi:AraC-like DNA-binding protein
MHMLFESTGQSFSQTVTARRICLSGQLLRESPGRPIAEVARACGFESLATFYRVFHATVGMPPGEFRARDAQSGAHQPPVIDHQAATHLTAK